MPETSNYECATEIRDAVWSLRDEVTRLLYEIIPEPGTQLSFRQRAAIAVLSALVSAEKSSFPFALLRQNSRERFALVAWGAADALLAMETVATQGNLGERIAQLEDLVDPPISE